MGSNKGIGCGEFLHSFISQIDLLTNFDTDFSHISSLSKTLKCCFAGSNCLRFYYRIEYILMFCD